MATKRKGIVRPKTDRKFTRPVRYGLKIPQHIFSKMMFAKGIDWQSELQEEILRRLFKRTPQCDELKVSVWSDELGGDEVPVDEWAPQVQESLDYLISYCEDYADFDGDFRPWYLRIITSAATIQQECKTLRDLCNQYTVRPSSSTDCAIR